LLIGKLTTLRPLEREDLAIVAAWRNDPAIRAHFFTPYLITTSGQGGWFDRYLQRHDSLIFVICAGSAQERVGLIGLDHLDHRNQSAEYGRLLIASAEARRLGYAKDATETLLAYAFGELNLRRIYLRVYADNTGALGLYERCGFTREGVEREAVFMGGRFRDVVLMSVLRGDRP
jgi:diamine N-acetyltransferase